MADRKKSCYACSRVLPNLTVCSRCHTVYYCSKTCQTNSWSDHKEACLAARKARRLAAKEIKQKNDLNQDESSLCQETNQHVNESKPNEFRGDALKEKNAAMCSQKLNNGNEQDLLNKECGSCHVLGCTLKCSVCKVMFYCSRPCQKLNWKLHKLVCQPNLTQQYTTPCDSEISNRSKITGLCKQCNSQTATVRCSKCKTTFYCSIQCQVLNWPEHKNTCSSIVKDESICTKDRSRDTVSNGQLRSENCAYCQRDHCSLKCSKCKTTYYCSTPCQTMDWSKHKLTCGKQLLSKMHDISLDRNDQLSEKSEMYKTEKTAQNDNKHAVTREQQASNEENSSHQVPKECKKDPVQAQDDKQICAKCFSVGSLLTCSTCRVARYCSRDCQKADWPDHKKTCEKRYTAKEKAIIDDRLRLKREQKADWANILGSEGSVTVSNHFGDPFRMFQMLTPDQCLVNERRPPGSLKKALRVVRMFFPMQKVIEKFCDVPQEMFFPFLFMPRRDAVLVAFMFKYHEHVMRHGVYLKDADDNESKVEFYLDEFGDIPWPYFTYDEVKPGSYICLLDPVMHYFADGTVGIRINHPGQVKVIDNAILI